MATLRPSFRTASLTLSQSHRGPLRTPRTTQRRALSATRTAHEENTYFSRTPRNQQQGSQSQAPIVVVQPDHARSHGGSPNARRWPHWLLGFAAFPVVWLAGNAAYALGLVPFTDPEAAAERQRTRAAQASQLAWDASASSGAEPSTPDIAAGIGPQDAARLVEAAYQHKERADSWERNAQRSDVSAARTQALLIELLTSAPGDGRGGAGLGAAHRAVRDDALLARPPVPVPPDAAFLADPARASLIRVVDGAGRNRALVLGVAPAGEARPGSRGEAYDALEPVWAWLYAVGEELHHAGANAAGKDLPLYVWSREWFVENSVAAQGPTFLVVSAGDVPPGFPIDVMRRVRGVDGAEDGEGDGDGERATVRHEGLGVVLAGGGKKAEDREG